MKDRQKERFQTIKEQNKEIKISREPKTVPTKK